MLSRERTCQWLVDAIERAQREHEFDVWAYVFMPDHVHLVLWPRTNSLQIRAVLAAITLPVSRRAIAFVRAGAPDSLTKMLDAQPGGGMTHRFWQRGGGYDRDLREHGTIHATIEYIQANPVRKGLAERPELWRWSSAAFFAGTGQSPLRPDADSILAPPGHWKFWSSSS